MKQLFTISAASVIATSVSGLQAQEEQKATFPPISALDILVVTANRGGQTLFEQIQPASVLTGDQLLLRLEPTLGETLNRLPGVSSTGFAPGSSRPILRGLGDDRIRILQNGTSALDVSNISADHAVSFDPLSIRSVEVVRGPASLLYGPNTIGGVVNVIDNRIAEERFAGTYPTGSFSASGGTADNSLSQGAEITWGQGPIVFHLDAFNRNTEDLEIPGFARSDRQRAQDNPADPQPFGTVPNSFSNSEGIGLGSSYIFEKGYLGFSFSGIDSDYGTVGEPEVTIGLEQRRWDMRGAVYDPATFLREINFKLGYSDYTHTEFEGPDVGTVFEIEGFNGRVEFLHNPVAGFEGAVGYEIQASDFSALGDEAFLPPVANSTNSLFFFEEKEFGKTRLQFGARYDHQSNETSDTVNFGPSLSRDFDAFSASAGIIYNPTEDYAASLSLAYTQRPPTYVEMFANGPHVATSTFEVGDPNLGKEEAFSIDLSLRKKSGWVTGSASAFYYRFNDYISLNDTGVIDPVDSLPIFAYQPINADFYGFELEAIFHLFGAVEAPVEDDSATTAIATSSRLDLILRADYVHAEDRDTGDAVPRIPPFRTTVALEYGNGPVSAGIDGQYAATQDHNAAFELPTDSFFLLGANVSYKTSFAGLDSTIYLRGVNLTDAEARLSTSFLKDVAPLAGRGVIVGIRSEF